MELLKFVSIVEDYGSAMFEAGVKWQYRSSPNFKEANEAQLKLIDAYKTAIKEKPIE